MKNHDDRKFPREFVWGVATAAPQIEGAAFTDGKGESTWDHFARQPGRIANGDTLDVACDHYHRYREDFALMQKLGVKNYRLSIAWPRLFPEGAGAVNQKGVDFYHRLIDAVLEAGMTPWVTFFHWDLPQALEAKGGWRVRAVPEAFVAYANTLVRNYGDRVKRWITLNEIGCFTRMAYGGTIRPPAMNEPEQVINQTYHHALLAHGAAVRAVREYGGRGAKVGLTDDSRVFVPVIEDAANTAAARRAFVDANVRVLDPIFRGHYSRDYLRVTGKDRAKVQRGDFDLIALPTDFLGLNTYTGNYVRAGRRGRPEVLPLPRSYPQADADWLKLLPQALYWGPRLAHDVYRPKEIYITENGAGYDDPPPVNGEVIDLHRREYVRQGLVELHRAVQHRVPVRGYFFWSFMDNFEWADGYTRRFGLVYVDYRTQRRTPKLSARWYAEVMRTGRVV
jgi:beta-glucosidase